jgi:UDP-N-acetylglucosamine 2-epimerase
VNIGDRQAGRLQASSIINCQSEVAEIVQAIEQALSPAFQQSLASVQSLYGDGRAASQIAHLLKTTNIQQIIRKRFYDLTN